MDYDKLFDSEGHTQEIDTQEIDTQEIDTQEKIILQLPAKDTKHTGRYFASCLQ